MYIEGVAIDVSVRILTGERSRAFGAVLAKFRARARAVEARYSTEIHGRAIFVDDECWVIGQSLKDAAMKKPTYLLTLLAKDHDETLDAYEGIWRKAVPIDGA